MGLIKYGLAVGIGYHFGQPDGHRQLLWLRRQITELAREPAITQLRERGRDLARDRALAAKNLAAKKLSGKSTAADAGATTPVADTVPANPRNWGLPGRRRRRPSLDPVTLPTAGTALDPAGRAAATGIPADGAAPTGFGGRTVAEDSQAAITGMAPPPPAGRVPPTAPPTDPAQPRGDLPGHQ